MFRDDLAGADLGGEIEGNLLVVPRGFDHTRRVVLDIAQRGGHDIAHAVDHSHPEGSGLVQTDLDGFLRNEFRLGGHDGASGSRLRHFIGGSLYLVLAAHVGNDQRFHELLDEGGFARSHRTDHAYIYIAAGAFGDVSVDFGVSHVFCSPSMGVFLYFGI